MSENLAQRCYAACNRLTKWKSIFSGWQLGTRPKGDPESDAVRDHREVTILLQAEMNALLDLCINNGVCTIEDWHIALAREADLLSKDYEKKFPGCKATDIGMDMDVAKVATYMKNWRP